MSGIFGILFRDSRHADSKSLSRMAKTLARRGPDGECIWCKEEIGLGNRFLWATPESVGENRLATDAAERRVVTADARIDNREELYSSLEIPKEKQTSITDSRLILSAYGKWGERCPQYIIGDFAFVIWDPQQHVAFCVRDHFGVKPFYYYLSDQLFVFASEVNALLAVKEVPAQINKTRIADYLVEPIAGLEGYNKKCTFYKDIVRLPPAHTLTVNRYKVAMKKYWQLDPDRKIQLQSENAYSEAFLAIFRDAVHCRLRSSSNPASMLSGGMDSSAIVGIARMQLPQHTQLYTYSAVSRKGIDCRETKAINQVLTLGNVKPHCLLPDELSKYIQEIDQLEQHRGEPFDMWMLIPQLMYIAARRSGLRVLLDGIPGDETVSLPPSYIAWLLRTRKWKSAAVEMNGFAKFWSSPRWVGRQLARQVWSAFCPQPAKKVWTRINEDKYLNGVLTSSMINLDFAKEVDLAGRLEQLAKQNHKCIGDISQRHAEVLNHTWLTVGLERYDRVASTLGIEPRHPFMDKRLVEFCLALPWSQKVRSGWNKHILRRSMKNILPEEVRWRTGRDHLSGKFNKMMLEEKRDVISSFVENTLPEMEEFVDCKAVQKKFQEFQNTEDIWKLQHIWHIAALRVWLDNSP